MRFTFIHPALCQKLELEPQETGKLFDFTYFLPFTRKCRSSSVRLGREVAAERAFFQIGLLAPQVVFECRITEIPQASSSSLANAIAPFPSLRDNWRRQYSPSPVSQAAIADRTSYRLRKIGVGCVLIWRSDRDDEIVGANPSHRQ